MIIIIKILKFRKYSYPLYIYHSKNKIKIEIKYVNSQSQSGPV